jgi:hypothetical protein
VTYNSNFKILYNFLYQLKKTVKSGKPIMPVLPFVYKYIKFNRIRNKTAFDSELPWINIGALEYLIRILKPNMKVFEYGAGGSTLFLSKRVAEIVSVEHEKEWYYAMKQKIKNSNNISLVYIEPIEISSSEYCSVYGRGWEKHSFEAYVKVIDQYPDSHFDLVVIDGRSRPACLRHALRKIKKGGYLLFDNSDRENYQNALNNIEDKLVYRMYGPAVNYLSFTQTSIYQIK